MAIIGAGAQLQLFTGGVYTAVAGIVSIGGPHTQVADVDITNLSSPNLFKQFLAGWADGQTVDLEANYDHLAFQGLYTQLRVMNAWKIVFADGSFWGFNGYINAIATDNPLETQVTMPFSIKVSGQPTFTP